MVKELVERYKISRGNSLLGVGCGTGKHLQHLTGKFDLGRFEVVRVDITRIRGDLSVLDEMSLAP